MNMMAGLWRIVTLLIVIVTTMMVVSSSYGTIEIIQDEEDTIGG